MQILNSLKNAVLVLSAASLVASCGGGSSSSSNKSATTGWKYNDKTQGGFSVAKPKDIKTAPGLVFVQGGTFTMGQTQEDIMVTGIICQNVLL